jgi:hypothetical protein
MIGAVLAAAAFGVLAYRHLRSAAYSPPVSATGAALVSGQILAAITTAFAPALLLVLAVYLIAVCAAAFVRVQNVRNVMLLSGSLALVQAVNPLGTVMAATLVPVLIGLQDGEAFRSRRNALLVLLLFMPVSAAVFLAYLAHTTQVSFSELLAHAVAQNPVAATRPVFRDFRTEGLVRALELIVIALPVWATAAVLRSRASIAIMTVCLAMIVATAVAIFLGRLRPVAMIAPAFALPFVLTMREWPRTQRHMRWAIAAQAFGAVLTWFCAAFAA